MEFNPGRTYMLIKNTAFNGVPTVPSGHADKIVFSVTTNVLANAEQVLHDQADVFNPGDTLPAEILQQVKTQAAARYQLIPNNNTYFFYMAVNQKPFNNLYARQAVLAAMDDRALSRLDTGFMSPDCHMIPPTITRFSPSTCRFHNPDAAPNMAVARQLMKRSGMIGQLVKVYGEQGSPQLQYTDYFTDLLNSLGFKATEEILGTGTWYTAISAPSTKPQAGYSYYVQDFPTRGTSCSSSGAPPVRR